MAHDVLFERITTPDLNKAGPWEVDSHFEPESGGPCAQPAYTATRSIASGAQLSIMAFRPV